MNFLTVPKIGNLFPNEPVNRAQFNIPKGLQLAGPKFDNTDPEDMLFSVGTTLAIMCQGQIRLNEFKGHDMIVRETCLGWIIGGSILSDSTHGENFLVQNKPTSIENKLKDFWEMDDVSSTRVWSKEEQACEEHFVKNVKRDINNKYVVALPLNGKEINLGRTMQSVLNRFKTFLR